MSIDNPSNFPERDDNNQPQFEEQNTEDEAKPSAEDAYDQEVKELSDAISANYDKAINSVRGIGADLENDTKLADEFIEFKAYFGEMIRRLYASDDRLLDDLDTLELRQNLKNIEKLFLDNHFEVALEMFNYIIEVGKAASNGHAKLDGAFLLLAENVLNEYITQKKHPETSRLYKSFKNWTGADY